MAPLSSDDPGELGNVIPFPGRSLQPDLDGSTAPSRSVTILMADLRGWKEVAERIGVPRAQAALSHAVDEILETLGERGAGDITVEGGSTQPAVTSTFEGPSGPARALDAAVAIRRATARAQVPSPPEEQFRIGSGIDAGEITASRTPDGVSFDSVGTIRMCATRLRDFAGPGQVFLSDTTYEQARHLATAQPLGAVRINPHGETREAYSLTDLRTP